MRFRICDDPFDDLDPRIAIIDDRGEDDLPLVHVFRDDELTNIVDAIVDEHTRFVGDNAGFYEFLGKLLNPD